MLNVNKWLADALAAGDVELKCSEEPMLDNVGDSPYITWEHGKIRVDRASGVVFREHFEVNLFLWLPADEKPWQGILQLVERALVLYDGIPGVCCYISSATGALEAAVIGRKVVQLGLLIEDRRAYS